MRGLFATVMGAAMVLALAGSAQAAQVEVKMLNSDGAGHNFVFSPNLIRIKPGDSVHFVATNMGHDAASIKGMLPKGAQPFQGKMSQDVTVKYTVPGIYGVECEPHYALGMVALVVVGDKAPNLKEAEAVRHPGRAEAEFKTLFKEYAAGDKKAK